MRGRSGSATRAAFWEETLGVDLSSGIAGRNALTSHGRNRWAYVLVGLRTMPVANRPDRVYLEAPAVRDSSRPTVVEVVEPA